MVMGVGFEVKTALFSATDAAEARFHTSRGGAIAQVSTAKYFPAMQLPFPSEHSFPLILAPMAGVSEAPYRQVCRRMGADVVLSEFLSSEAIRRRIRHHAGGRRVRGGRAADRHPDLRRRSERDGGGGAAHHRALPAGVHRHQLRLPGQEGRAAERRLRLPPGSRPGGPDHPRGHRRDAPAGDGQDPERLERPGARSGGHRAPDAGRRRAGLHPARPHPHPDVLRPGRLGRDRPRGGGPGHSGVRQRRHHDRRGYRADARSHRLRRRHGRARRVRQSLALPRRPGAARRPSRSRRRRTRASGSRSRWTTRGWRSGSRATPARP